MSTGRQTRSEMCQVDFDGVNPNTTPVVSLSNGTQRWSATAIQRSPDIILAILLQYGWINEGKHNFPNTSRYYWYLSRASIAGRALDDALRELLQS